MHLLNLVLPETTMGLEETGIEEKVALNAVRKVISRGNVLIRLNRAITEDLEGRMTEITSETTNLMIKGLAHQNKDLTEKEVFRVQDHQPSHRRKEKALAPL